MCLDDGNSDPNYMKRYEDRLKTFKNWEYFSIKPEVLAKNGFYYYGPKDATRCIFCKVIIGNWETFDNVEVEHQKYSSNCPMVKDTENVRKLQTFNIKCKLCNRNEIRLLLYPCLHFINCEYCKNIHYCPIFQMHNATVNRYIS